MQQKAEEERKQKQEAREKRQKLIEKKQKEKKRKAKILNRKTSRGQPIMKNLIEYYVGDKLTKVLDNEKAENEG